jgi:hypothetical protein
VAGATGAWASGFTQQFYRPVGATGASWQTLAKTSDELNTAMGERTTAERKLTEVTNSQITSAEASVTAAQGRVTSAQARLDQAEAKIAELTANGADASKLSVAATKRDAAMQALEAARVFEEGVVTDVREADVRAILCFGFEPFTGGPLSMIDFYGVKAFIAEAEKLHKKHGERFKVPQILHELAAKKETFYGLYPPEGAAGKAA